MHSQKCLADRNHRPESDFTHIAHKDLVVKELGNDMY